DRLLAAVGLRRRAAADVGARLDVGDGCLQHGGDHHVVRKIERDRGTATRFREDCVAVDPLDRAGQTLGLLLLLGINSGNRERRDESGGSQDAQFSHCRFLLESFLCLKNSAPPAYNGAQPKRKVSCGLWEIGRLACRPVPTNTRAITAAGEFPFRPGYSPRREIRGAAWGP